MTWKTGMSAAMRFELGLGGVPVDGNMRADAGDRLEVSPDDPRALRHRNLGGDDGAAATADHRGSPAGCSEVLRPVALAEHADQVPAAIEVGQPEREADRSAAHPSGNLEADPPAREDAPRQDPVVPAQLCPGRVASPTTGIHGDGCVPPNADSPPTSSGSGASPATVKSRGVVYDGDSSLMVFRR